ncbi:ABC transporter permease [Hyphomicrobium sp. CS1GBMeth3]|uniref:ABC transporter permease n=1 Tax=Hyphomicrobium sp. CS1GBMeth3 TaxID=1892845 RepID=UPI000931A6CD|nr:ABC transporter permease [Hyphomicrobium sp. CS1GBMeth3]
MLAVTQSALSDIRAGFRLRRVWLALAGEDIGDQHKSTVLGPLWLLFNYLAFAGVFIFIFNTGDGSPHYAAHVATGLLVWFFIMETLTLSVSLFVREESFIKGTTLPLTVYVMRLTMQSTIRAGYASVGCLGILALSGTPVTAAWAWALVGILLILVTTPAAITVFAFLGAYFPDSQFIVNNVMRVGMFLTPVFWSYDGSDGIRHIFYWWNPFTYFLDVVRVPIVSGAFPAYALAVCAAICILAWTFAIALLGRYRKQVVFML